MLFWKKAKNVIHPPPTTTYIYTVCTEKNPCWNFSWNTLPMWFKLYYVMTKIARYFFEFVLQYYKFLLSWMRGGFFLFRLWKKTLLITSPTVQTFRILLCRKPFQKGNFGRCSHIYRKFEVINHFLIQKIYIFLLLLIASYYVFVIHPPNRIYSKW